MTDPGKKVADEMNRRAAGTVMLDATMSGLTKIFPGCGIVLLVAPFDAPEGGRVNYVSNVDRGDIVVLLKELVARFEGRAHDAPEARQ